MCLSLSAILTSSGNDSAYVGNEIRSSISLGDSHVPGRSVSSAWLLRQVSHRSRFPVLAIATQIPSKEIGSGYFQETHPDCLFEQCSHYCELVPTRTDPSRPGIRHSALNLAH